MSLGEQGQPVDVYLDTLPIQDANCFSELIQHRRSPRLREGSGPFADNDLPR